VTTYGMMNRFPNGFHDRDYVCFVCKMIYPKQSLQLLKTNYYCCSTHEPNNGCMRHKIHKETQPIQQYPLLSMPNLVNQSTVKKSDSFTTLYANLNTPKAAWNIPAKKVAVNTSFLYPFGSMAGSVNFSIIDDKRSDTTATGPIAISLELPIKAYIRGGTTLVSDLFIQTIHFKFTIQNVINK